MKNIRDGNIISTRLVKARKHADLSQINAATAMEISPVTLNRYEKGHREPSISSLVSMANFYGVRESWLITGEGPMLEAEQQHEPPNVASPPSDRYISRMVPVISWIQAGDWKEVSDIFHPGDADQWVDTASTDSQYAFALVVHGDSMEPEFRDGDVIVVDPELSPDSGDYVIAKNGDDATFKQFVRDGSSVFLKPLNERYPIKDMTGVKNFRIVGVVREKKSRYR